MVKGGGSVMRGFANKPACKQWRYTKTALVPGATKSCTARLRASVIRLGRICPWARLRPWVLVSEHGGEMGDEDVCAVFVG